MPGQRHTQGEPQSPSLACRYKLSLSFLAASALGAASSGASAHGYGHSYGYSYDYQPSYEPTYQVSSYYSCRTVSFQVWDEYSCQYVIRTKEICH
jgi:hypothetical protein